MEKKRILIVDDEEELSGIMAEMLTGCGYEAECAADAAQAYDMLSEKSYHLILLDINLPDDTGFEICKELRRTSQTPVIFASARTSEDDRINSFDLGGDDYLQKPYSMKELLSRVNALMRRAYGDEGQVMRFGDVTVNTANRSVIKGGRVISLAQREFDLLEYLCRNKNSAVPKEKLISEVWGAFSEVEPSTLTVHIRWLREKLEDDPAEPKYIKTIWRLGYMLEDKQLG
ncbi:response regulator transcription factor [uncultured Ruminococcus sp.]|uniref:response regulator transcription factor n=1 Tax=uncultured Ruminococcus sp. TaxID=165186 RepID=UPI0025E9B4CA|nr:response regulator transcription factor [uncultured Ruminococcus sp.]